MSILSRTRGKFSRGSTSAYYEKDQENDPAAMSKLGRKLCNQGDYKTALEYLTKAAKLGDADAHFGLSIMYDMGQGVKKDMKKQVHHLEEAAIGGHPSARHNLGCIESGINRRFERARKHFIIAANLGNEDSLKMVKHLHTMGHASKEDYADALRAYQTAVEATKSQQREEAEAYYKARNSGCAQS